MTQTTITVIQWQIQTRRLRGSHTRSAKRLHLF